MLLSSNVALIGGNSTKPGSSYYALIKAVLSLAAVAPLWTYEYVVSGACFTGLVLYMSFALSYYAIIAGQDFGPKRHGFSPQQ